MFDWLPQKQPQQAFAVFGLVAALSVLAIVPLALSDGDNGVGDAIKEADQARSSSTTATPPPTTTTPPPATTPPPTTTPGPEPTPKPPVERPVGGTAEDDGLRLTVNSLDEVTRIDRDDYYKRDYKPRGSGSLVAAEVTYVNRTKSAIDPFCGGNNIVLVDQNGRMHKPLEELYSIMGNDAVCSSAGTLAGDTATVVVGFRLKRGERIDHLDVWNGEYDPDFDGSATRVRFSPR